MNTVTATEVGHRMVHMHVAETDSTMQHVRLVATQWPDREFVLLSADFQTAGRGQRGNHWESERGSNLLFSLLFHPRFLAPCRQFALSEICALAVCETLRNAFCEAEGRGAGEADFSVKWPNDIYYGDHKICGMLIEHNVVGAQLDTTVAGVGINVNQQRFESDAPNPISLAQILGSPVSTDRLRREFCVCFLRLYDRLQQGAAPDVHAEYLAHLYWRDGWHPYRDARGFFEARVARVSPDGMLTLCLRDGSERTYAFKEVSHVLGAPSKI